MNFPTTRSIARSSRETRKSTIYLWVLLVVYFVVLLPRIQPASFDWPTVGLDPSYSVVMAEVHEQGWHFGSEIVFNYGPWASLITRQFQQDTAILIMVASLLATVFIAWGLAELTRATSSSGVAIFMIAIAAMMTFPNQSFFMSIPALMVIVNLNCPRINWGFSAIGILVGAIASLAKFTIFPLFVLACLILDGVAIVHRRAPMHLVSATVAMIVLFSIIGQEPGDLLKFIKGGFEISSGYTAAMSIPGHPLEWLLWLTMAGCLIAPLLLQVRNGSSLSFKTRSISYAYFLIAIGSLFVLFKLGFVRHDLHSLVAWGGLAIVGLLYGALLYPARETRKWAKATFALMIIAGTAYFALLSRASHHFSFPLSLQTAQTVKSQIAELVQCASNPDLWLQQHQARRISALEAIRSQHPLPAFDGAVDVIPSIQSNLIANKLDYRPRPTIQEYTTYSAPLIERNRRFFESGRAPEYLLMQPGSIDNRHSASAEGALWPLFLERYEPALRVDEMIALRKRQSPLVDLLGIPVETTARFREDIALPPGADPLFFKADIRMTLFGRALEFIFKPPMTQMVAHYGDGTRQAYRIIPAMIREGMIISPLVSTATDYLLLAAGHLETPLWHRPIAIQFEMDWLGKLAYDPTIAISFTPIRADMLRKAAHGNELIATLIVAEKKRLSDLADLLAHNTLNPLSIKLVKEGLLAHAPTTLTLPVTPGARLRLAFGLIDGTWQGGSATNGVCFLVRVPNDATTLFERCLNPKTVVADRGLQKAAIAIRTGAIGGPQPPRHKWCGSQSLILPN